MSGVMVVPKNSGTVVQGSLGAPFFVNDPSSVWLVEAGDLDLFLVRATDGEATGARHHVMRVGAGQAVFGPGRATHPQFTLLAVPNPGCELTRFEIGNLDSGGGSKALALLECWVESLAEVACTVLAPPRFLALEKETDTVIVEEPQAVLPLNGVVWLRHEGGELQFLGLPGLDVWLPGEAVFPVTRHGWLQAAPNTRIHTVDVARLVSLDSCWAGLQIFHSLAISCLVEGLVRQEQKELERFKAQTDADASRIETALLQLAAPLVRVAPAATPSSCSSLLLVTAQAVGKAMGIQIKAPPELVRGMNLSNPVAAIARVSKVRVRRVALKGKWWTKDAGPILAFRDSDNSPVALLPRTATSYELFDPESRTTTLVEEKAASRLNDFAYTFYRPFPPVALNAFSLLSFGATRSRGDIWTIVLMGIASGVLATIAPIATGIMFDSVIPGAQRNQLFTLTLFLVISAISTAMFNIVRSFATLRLEGKMDAAIQAAVWDRLLALPVPFFRDYSSGDLASRSMGISQIRGILTGSTLSSILTGIFSVFSFALLFYYSVPLALAATALAALAIGVTTTSGYLQIRHQREITRIRGRISGMVLQFLHGISKFRISGTEHRAFVAWARDYSRQKELSVKARNISNRLAAFNATYPVICTALIFYCASLLKSRTGQALTTGAFLAFLSAFMQFMMAALQLSSSAVAILGIVPLYERAKPILQTLPEASSSRGIPGDFLGEIEVNHVTFRYRPETPLILRDVSMSIMPGQFVAFVGPSGCGKSTLLRLLLGFERPESGAIYYDRQDLSGLDLQAVRQQMGVVLQSAKLFSGSIFTNIVGSAPLTEKDALEAARLAGFDRDIQNMPMGLHTMISEGGGGLSGGQRQRLLIARAIVKKPRIILFDEATSALDNQTQATVSRSLEGLQATRIVVAHRLSTIVNAHRVFVLEQGRVVQCGTCDELMRVAGPFQALAKRQIV